MTTERVPVLLVPGWSDRASFLETLRRRFVEAGWSPERVGAVDFTDRHGCNMRHAAEIAEAARRLSRCGPVDVVAHSMGGLALRYLVLESAEPPVRRAAFLATPHDGTWAAWLAWGEGARQMRTGSDFLERIAGPLPVPSLALYTPFDTHVLPQRSAVWAHARNVRVWTLHRAMVRSAPAFRAVKEFFVGEVAETTAPPDSSGDRSSGP